MFAKTIIDSDAFLDMPLSAQALYFHLSMRADDEGFINNPKKIQRMIGSSDDDMRILLAKNFVLRFESGVIVIKHWKIHNYIRGDRLNETAYQEEKALLTIKDNGAYTLCEDLKEIEKLDAKDLRKIAYKESSLPYSFTYKIKRAFEGEKCPVCGTQMTSAYKRTMPTVQHNTPISKGGKHEIDNISIICESCNASIRNTETDSLNNEKVIEMWDKIVEAEKNKIDWFWDISKLDSQMSDICQSNDRIGKDRLDKDRLDKDRLGKDKEPKHKYGEYSHVMLTDKERDRLMDEFGEQETLAAIKFLDEYIEEKGYKSKNHNLALRRWVFDAIKRDKQKVQTNNNKQSLAEKWGVTYD